MVKSIEIPLSHSHGNTGHGSISTGGFSGQDEQVVGTKCNSGTAPESGRHRGKSFNEDLESQAAICGSNGVIDWF